MKRWTKVSGPLVLAVLFLFFSGFQCAHRLKSDLPVADLKIDGQALEVEVANKEATRMSGLMFRKEMDWNAGMLFVFPDSQIRAFWMKNTFIPLSIAFIDDKGAVLNVLEMPPQTEDSFFSKGYARFALEMNSGWFEKLGVKPGDKVEGILDAPKAQD